MGQELKARTGGQLDRVRDSPASETLSLDGTTNVHNLKSHLTLKSASTIHPFPLLSLSNRGLWGLLQHCWILVLVSGKPCADLTAVALGSARSRDCAFIGTRCHIPNTSLCLAMLERRTKTIWGIERKCKQASCLPDSPSTEWTTYKVETSASAWQPDALSSQADFWSRYTNVLCSHAARTEV